LKPFGTRAATEADDHRHRVRLGGWKVAYSEAPDAARNFETANEIHIPVGAPVKIELLSQASAETTAHQAKLAAGL
jgi:hypothetical protein